jgi:hypothetical protein
MKAATRIPILHLLHIKKMQRCKPQNSSKPMIIY